MSEWSTGTAKKCLFFPFFSFKQSNRSPKMKVYLCVLPPSLLLLSGFSRVRLCSPPVSSVPGIIQARRLEWVAISFSNAWKWNVKVKSLSCVWLLATPWTAAHKAPPSMRVSRQEYWSGLPLPSPASKSRGNLKGLEWCDCKFPSCSAPMDKVP